MERLINRQLNAIIDILIVFFAFITLPGVGISLSRIPAIGIQPEMYFHIVLSIFVVMLAFNRKKVPFLVKSWVAVIFLFIVGYSGFFSIGLSSSGRLDVVIGIAIACLFISLKTGVILSAINLVLFGVVAYMHVKGYLDHGIDFNTYNYAVKSWTAAFYNFSAMGIIIVLLCGFATQQMRRNLKSLMDKKKRLHREISQRKNAEEKYRELSRIDPLTGLYNRRFFFEKATEELNRSNRYDRKLSLIMVDADHFKNINDLYGHQAGDHVLLAIAERFDRALRPSDIACRFGGEEFCVLLPETGAKEAVMVAERLRQAILAEPVIYCNEEISLTCSFGIAESLNDEHADSLMNRADQALYTAKKKGRNTVVVF